jgi:hypothetical protein
VTVASSKPLKKNFGTSAKCELRVCGWMVTVPVGDQNDESYDCDYCR